MPVNRSSGTVAWASDDKEKKDWFLSAEAREEALAGRASPAPPPPLPPLPSSVPVLVPESSTDASVEENLYVAPALRVSGDSTDSGGGGGSRRSDGIERAGGGGASRGNPETLRIWPPGKGSHSRESSAGEMIFVAGGDADSGTSPTRSAESDTELLSPKGFWREDFETIDARNAARRFSGWEDVVVAPGQEESSRGRGENSAGKGATSGATAQEGSGGASCRADRAGGGRPPLRKDGGNPAPLEDQADPPLAGAAGVGVKVGRKLFSSPEKSRRKPPLSSNSAAAAAAAAASGNASSVVAESGLEPMVEVDIESPSPSSAAAAQPSSSFWAPGVEPTAAAVRVEGKEGGSGLGWRRGEAGLVVPEPNPQQKPRAVIQSVVPQRAPRIGGDAQQSGGGAEGGDGKRPLSAPRPATTSPTLPAVGEHKSKAAKELQQALSPGVKITRSYSYHGLGSMALYDSAKRG